MKNQTVEQIEAKDILLKLGFIIYGWNSLRPYADYDFKYDNLRIEISKNINMDDIVKNIIYYGVKLGKEQKAKEVRDVLGVIEPEE